MMTGREVTACARCRAEFSAPALEEPDSTPHAVCAEQAADDAAESRTVDVEYIEDEEQADSHINEYHQNTECESRTFRGLRPIVTIPFHNLSFISRFKRIATGSFNILTIHTASGSVYG